MKEQKDLLFCYVTADEELNYLGIFAFEEEPRNSDLVHLLGEEKYYVVITDNADINVDEFQVEEITKVEFDKFSKEWICSVLEAKNIYNKSQEMTPR